MPQEGSNILVAFLDVQNVGFEFERRRRQWPAHITLVSWFEVSEEEGFDLKLGKEAQDSQPFDLTLGARHMFGPKHDVPVNVIADQRSVAALHIRLSEIVTAPATTQPTIPWTGDAYRAHVTRHGNDDDHSSDDKVTVDSFYRVRLLPGNICHILKRYRFGASDETAA